MNKLGQCSLTGSRWHIQHHDEMMLKRLAEELDVGRLAARALACRGIMEPEAGRVFLQGNLSNLLQPDEMQDMSAATMLLSEAIDRELPIRIYGDYDVDGVCATALLVRALRRLDARVDWYIPHRIDEGYGLNEEAVRQACREGIKLLITVDCGSTAVEQVALARSLGMEVLITDHHRPGETLPETVVLNPWRSDCRYPFKELAGVGVAFKLVSALARYRGLGEGAELRFLDLVCLGTVADVVPLLGENRLFVQHGLRMLAESRKVGINALRQAVGLAGQISAQQVAFVLAPRINAAGRMEHAQAAVRLLLTEDAAEAGRLATQLSEQNARRREEELQTLAQADQRITQEVDLSREKVIVLASQDWHPGVIGIVASRLVQRYRRPALLVALSDGIGKGSGRSIPSFNLWEAMCACAPLLTRFGGHRFAAGFGIMADQVEPFRRLINQVADECLSMDDLVREIEIDSETTLDELTQEAIGELNCLAPFGTGNPAPILMTSKLRLAASTPVGDGAHLSLRVRNESGLEMDAIWFGQGQLQAQLPPGETVSICYRAKLDEWNGRVRVRMHVEDVAFG